MFRCGKCAQSAQRMTKVVVERKMVNHGTGCGPHNGHGSQIVRELSLCEACAVATPEAPIETVAVVEEKLSATIGDAV